jgi:hypothetical protein
MLSTTTSSPTVAGIGSLSRARMVSTVTVIGCNASVAGRTAERIPAPSDVGSYRNSLHRPWPLSLVGLGPPRRFPRRRRAVRVSCDRIERLGADVGRSDVNGRYSTRRCNHSWRLPPTIMPGSAERYCPLGQYDSAALRCRPHQADPAPKSYFNSNAGVNFSAVTPRVSSAFSFVRSPPQGKHRIRLKGKPLVTNAPRMLLSA